jgi:D-threo-aldose 1-dehydrogenase
MVRLGDADVEVTRLGFGVAPLSGLYQAVTDEQAAVTLERAWDLGIRYYDAAPLYGYGLGEQRLGHLLRQHPGGEWAVSTKVGRLLYPLEVVEADTSLDRDFQRLGSIVEPGDGEAGTNFDDWYYRGVPDVRPVFDFSYDGVMRSFEASLERTGLDKLDILWIHDPDNHWEQAIGGAYPALEELRSQGLVKAIGAGMNQATMLTRFAREGDFDAFMLAGRYTLLDQRALEEFLPVCEEKGIGVVIAGVMNSGLLANPTPESHFDYGPASQAQEWLDKALKIQEICGRYGINQRAAALQFVYAHPAVATVVIGVRTVAHLDDTVYQLSVEIPDDLWAELKAEGLLAESAPTPSLKSAGG